jgi:MFS family permease
MSPTAFQFTLLAIINLFVGAMVGLERTILPLLAESVFGLERSIALGAFVMSFGISKSIGNLFAGTLADTFGRKGVLLVGWLMALPVPLLLINAPNWNWIIAANLLLGINQALTWSMTVNMMVDLVPANRRGIAAGINEFMGYLGVSLLAFLTGILASSYGLRPVPFYLGLLVAFIGLVLSLSVKETHKPKLALRLRWINGVGLPSLLGFMTNLKDGLVWLSLPLLLSARELSTSEIGLVAGCYPLIWASGQLVFGPLSDRVGRLGIIFIGMLLQGIGLMVMANAFNLFQGLLAAFILGLGTSMAYPTLIAYVADKTSNEQRASALGLYRFFRDSGYIVGAGLAGLKAVSLSSTLTTTGMLFCGIIVIGHWNTLQSLFYKKV